MMRNRARDRFEYVFGQGRAAGLRAQFRTRLVTTVENAPIFIRGLIDRIIGEQAGGAAGRAGARAPPHWIHAWEPRCGWEGLYLIFFKMVFALAAAQISEFVPDEKWQSTEVALVMVNGRGHLTWEWYQGLRSSIVPFIIAVLYKIGQLCGIENSPLFYTLAPQLLQAGLTFGALILFYDVAVGYCGRRAGRMGFFLMLMNWFTTYCGARTISNQTEMSLNIIGLWFMMKKRYGWMTLVITINFVIRNTAPIFWVGFLVPLVPKLVKPGLTWVERYSTHLTCGAIAGSLILASSILDILVNGTVSWWEFVKFNVFESGSALFGSNPFGWYAFNALPYILGPLGVLIPMGNHTLGVFRKLFFHVLFNLVIYSCIPHKEIRFVLPFLPLVFMMLGYMCAVFREKCEGPEHVSDPRKVLTGALWRMLAEVYVLTNFVTLFYIAYLHQCGVRPATQLVLDGIKNISHPKVWVMMPCYAVPIYTYMPHPTAEFEYYICPPEKYRSFYENTSLLIQPNGFETVNFPEDIKATWHRTGDPDYIIVYEEHCNLTLNVLKNLTEGFRRCGQFWHSYYAYFVDYTFVTVLCKK